MPSVGRRRERQSSPPSPTQELLGVVDVVNSPPGSEYLNREIGRYYTATSQLAESREVTIDQTNEGPPFLSGGDFLNIKTSLPRTQVQGSGVYYGQSSHGNIRYTGGFTNPFVVGDMLTDSFYTDWDKLMNETDLFPDLDGYGPEAWAKLKPRLDEVGLGVALAESRDLPRMMSTSAKGFHELWKAGGGIMNKPYMQPKTAADHYLNHQFGWVPFLSDMAKMYKAYDNTHKYMAQIKRDNGTWVKRRRVMSHTVSEEVIFDTGEGGSFAWRVEPADYLIEALRTSARYRILLRRTLDVWAVGKFVYYRPEFDVKKKSHDSSYDRMNRQMTMYGARINPSVVWKATPWSWLIDWFTDVGTSIDNLTAIANDSLVSQYMYLMHHTTRHFVLQQTVNFNGGNLQTLEWQRSVDIKRRRGALSPYGLGLSWGDLSARQLTILGALGLSRTRPI